MARATGDARAITSIGDVSHSSRPRFAGSVGMEDTYLLSRNQVGVTLSLMLVILQIY
jgi:hypothetical protein